MIKLFLLFFWVVSFFSCNQFNIDKTSKYSSDNLANSKGYKKRKASKIDSLLNLSLVSDSVFEQYEDPFLFFKSGYIISRQERNAIVICSGPRK